MRVALHRGVGFAEVRVTGAGICVRFASCPLREMARKKLEDNSLRVLCFGKLFSTAGFRDIVVNICVRT